MTSEITYYKVLTPNRLSIVVPDKIALTYPLLEWTKPVIEYSKLMVFINKFHAELFAQRERINHIIVSCHIKQTYFDSYVPILGMFTGTTPEHVAGFWKAFHDSKAFQQCDPKNPVDPYYQVAHLWAPAGTVFADEVYCLE